MPVVVKPSSKPIIHAQILDEANGLPTLESALDPRIKARAIEFVAVDQLKPNPRNAKKHPDSQIGLIEENYDEFGVTQPILIDENNMVLAGHARLAAAKRAGIKHLPAVRHSHLSPAQKRALVLSDNKLAELGSWDFGILSEEFEFLSDPNNELSFDPRITGFETVEIDQILDDDNHEERADPADQVEPIDPDAPVVTRAGEVWVCDQHRLICGDATNPEDYIKLMESEQAQLVFTDPPYNVPNQGHVSKRDGVREFAMAHGEMTPRQFTEFLALALTNVSAQLAKGAINFVCMDWRHQAELRAAADPLFDSPKNLIVWTKTNAGMGSFYRSAHEFIFVYAAPGKPINNFGLGAKGRHRTNVWRYPGCSSFGRGRNQALAMHPTVKPVAMVADALMDCSHRGNIVLDPFAGSGTTMIAAERTGRRARLMEIDPLYCDVIIQRWQNLFGKTARLAETNETYEEVKVRRAADRK
jgi:DNA modification methylase